MTLHHAQVATRLLKTLAGVKATRAKIGDKDHSISFELRGTQLSISSFKVFSTIAL